MHHRLQAQLESSQSARQQIVSNIEGLDISGLHDLANQMELIDKQNGELASLRQQKSMEVHSLQQEHEAAMETIKQEHLAAMEALEQTNIIRLQRLKAHIQALEDQLHQAAQAHQQQQHSQDVPAPDQDDSASPLTGWAKAEQMRRERMRSEVRVDVLRNEHQRLPWPSI